VHLNNLNAPVLNVLITWHINTENVEIHYSASDMIPVTKPINPLTNLVEVKPKAIPSSYTAYLKYYT